MFKKIVAVIVLLMMLTALFSTSVSAKSLSAGKSVVTATKGGGSGTGGGGMPEDRGRRVPPEGGGTKGYAVTVSITVNAGAAAEGGKAFLMREFGGVVDVQTIVGGSAVLTGVGFGDYQVVVIKKDAASINCFDGLNPTELLSLTADQLMFYLTNGFIFVNGSDQIRLSSDFSDIAGYAPISPYAGVENVVNLTGTDTIKSDNWLPIYQAIYDSKDAALKDLAVASFVTCVNALWTNYNGLVTEGE